MYLDTAFDLLTMAEVAKFLHCSKAHVSQAVAGKIRGCPPIPAVSLGRRKLVRRESLLHWIEENDKIVSSPEHRSKSAYGANMRRYLKGGVVQQRGRWKGLWYEDGIKKSRIVGLCKDMTKTEARDAVAVIVAKLNPQTDKPLFDEFVENVYFPYYSRKWKAKHVREQQAENADAPVGCIRGSDPRQSLARRAARFHGW
jgi:hypothetical protein